MRKCTALLLAIVVILSCVVCAFATTKSITKGSDLSFYGNTAYVSAYVRETGSYCTISAKLYKGNSLVGSWNDSDYDLAAVSDSVSGCISGQVYSLKVTATVNGISVPISTISKTCP